MQKLSQIQGVGQVHRRRRRAARRCASTSNPAQLASYGLTLANVQSVLSLQNADLAKGQLADGETTADILANDQISHAADYKPLVVGYSNGAAVRLSDVAEVTDSVQNIRVAGYLERRARRSRHRLPPARREHHRHGRSHPARSSRSCRRRSRSGIDIDVVLDRTTTIRASVSDVERTLVISIGLVILVVFVFLRNGRATLIPASPCRSRSSAPSR